MPYDIRNTLLLILILALLCTGGYLYLHFTYDDQLEALVQEIENKEETFSKFEGYMADLDYYYEEIDTYKKKIEKYPKTLLPDETVHQTYQYLEYLDSRGAFFNFTFLLQDVKEKEEVVTATYQLSGEGKFQKIAAFLYRLEDLPPIYRIDNFRLKSKGDDNDEAMLRVDVRLTGIFSKDEDDEGKSVHKYRYQRRYRYLRHDPFAPNILRKLPPNDDDLPVIEKSSLIAITGNTAYIKDQSNQMVKLQVGDEIYLGYLAKIDVDDGQATFEMNRGGIHDTAVLTLNQ